MELFFDKIDLVWVIDRTDGMNNVRAGANKGGFSHKDEFTLVIMKEGKLAVNTYAGNLCPFVIFAWPVSAPPSA